MGTFFGLIAIIFAVHQIIQFIKIWGITDDHRRIGRREKDE